MEDQFQKSNQMTFEDLFSVTGFAGFSDGLLLSDLLVGTTAEKYGQVPVPANRSARRAKGGESKTNDTSGRNSHDSSPSANLQRSLASRLRARLDVNGSPEYALTWKDWDMQSGPPICALRASARRTFDSDCFGGLAGWRTPDHNERGGDYSDPAKALARLDSGHQINLSDQAVLAGWPTPLVPNGGRRPKDSAMSATGQTPDGKKRTVDVEFVARLVGWGTPACRDHKDGDSAGTVETNGSLGRQVWMAGQTSTSSPAQTEKRGALNPAHSRWLQGYPVDWCLAAIRAHRKRKRQPKRA